MHIPIFKTGSVRNVFQIMSRVSKGKVAITVNAKDKVKIRDRGREIWSEDILIGSQQVSSNLGSAHSSPGAAT